MRLMALLAKMCIKQSPRCHSLRTALRPSVLAKKATYIIVPCKP